MFTFLLLFHIKKIQLQLSFVYFFLFKTFIRFVLSGNFFFFLYRCRLSSMQSLLVTCYVNKLLSLQFLFHLPESHLLSSLGELNCRPHCSILSLSFIISLECNHYCKSFTFSFLRYFISRIAALFFPHSLFPPFPKFILARFIFLLFLHTFTSYLYILSSVSFFLSFNTFIFTCTAIATKV